MDVTYNNYPALLYMSFDEETAPAEFVFELVSEDDAAFLSAHNHHRELLAYAALQNSIHHADTTTNYLLSDSMFKTIDSNVTFRTHYFKRFFETAIPPQHGTIIFRDGGQYVYLFLSENDTLLFKGLKGRYICTMVMKDNIFVGFEEALIVPEGLKVFKTGHYHFDMEQAGYISFVCITLSYASTQSNLPLYHSDKVKEKIFMLQ